MRAFLTVAVALSACADPTPAPSVAQSSAPIVGGDRELGWPAVGALTYFDRGLYAGAFCTGTLIDPEWVLTAAHCVEDENGQALDPRAIQFFIGDDADTFGEGGAGRWVPAQRAIRHPGWERAAFDFSANDIALLELAERVDDVEPIPVNDTRLDDNLVGGDVFYVGFGVNDGFNQVGGGLKRSTTLFVEGVRPTRYYSGADTSGVCYGDSGGPGLRRFGNRWRVIGVNSSLGYFDDEAEPCVGAAVHVRVDAHLPWLLLTMGRAADCAQRPQSCQCADACLPQGYCDDTRCVAPLSCPESVACFSGCQDDLCQLDCVFDTEASTLDLVFELFECAQNECFGAETLDDPCVRRACAAQFAVCEGEPPPPPPPPLPTTCAESYACTLECGSIANEDCATSCSREGDNREFAALTRCLGQCAGLGRDSEAWSRCSARQCGAQWEACLPADGCPLTGGRCDEGEACASAPWGGTQCFPTEDRDQRQCVARPAELGVQCSDGWVCTDAGRCEKACIRDQHCPAGERCDRERVSAAGLGACAPGPAPEPNPPKPEPNPEPPMRDAGAGPVVPPVSPASGLCNGANPPDSCDGEETVAKRDSGCSTGPGSAAWWTLLALMGIRRRTQGMRHQSS